MSRLADFEHVRKSLKDCKRNSIVVLHKFVFGRDDNRKNRKNLREFQGFKFDEKDKEYDTLLSYVAKNLKETDLVCICNLLGIRYDVDDVFKHIFTNLREGQLLCGVEEDDDDEEGEDDNDDGSSNDQTSDCDSIVASANQRTKNKTKKNDSFFSIGDNDNNNVHNNKTMARFAMSFRDVEDSIRTFNGDDTIPVETWLNEFEEMAVIMHWDKFQMYVFAKKAIRGLAKTFIMGEKGITNFDKLKLALIKEFKTCVNSAQLHKMLYESRMKKDENVTEYFYRMRDIASRGNIEEKAIMQYVIDGINDLNLNKSILYGANNLNEFKEKIKSYETFRTRVNKENRSKENTKNFKI